MGGEGESTSTIPIPTSLLIALIVALFGGGAGLGSVFSRDSEVQQCSAKAAEAALDLATSNEKELGRVWHAVQGMRSDIQEKTQERYKSSDASRDKSQQDDRDTRQERQLADHERRIGRLE